MDTFKQNFVCPVCKMTGFAVQGLFGNSIVQGLILDTAKVICIPVLSIITPYTWSACNGILDDQLDETLLPLFTHDLMEPTTLCTFIFEVCESTSWAKQDLSEYVHQQLA